VPEGAAQLFRRLFFGVVPTLDVLFWNKNVPVREGPVGGAELLPRAPGHHFIPFTFRRKRIWFRVRRDHLRALPVALDRGYLLGVAEGVLGRDGTQVVQEAERLDTHVAPGEELRAAAGAIHAVRAVHAVALFGLDVEAEGGDSGYAYAHATGSARVCD